MDDAQTWFKQGVALYEKGDYRRAITAFDKAIALDSSLAEAWNNRGLSRSRPAPIRMPISLSRGR